ncbi:MAG: SpoVA/SpoVAEb family sporulation membrane protein [Firmicutes bacterium]|nr:SpoVA/SpoVAEb family sporulation membrane protein [Clostridiales bacterium]MBQ4340484.1 SpoVA/SpoVAEb family sporulation membrane protein [Bacillota bacterium]
MKKSKNEKDAKKRYEEYVSRFTPGSRSVSNGIKAFVVGGALCSAAFVVQNFIQQNFGLESKEAGTIVTVGLIFAAQLLTGLGLYAPLAKFAGAGVIVPITGFANSMVATAMEFKSEGPVLGVGSKLFQLAGPVIVCGISVSVIVGLIYYVMGIFDFKLPWV